jgi:hypothetical protein
LGSGDVAVQPTLVSGTSIKTLNSVSLLGAGDIVLNASPSGVSGAIQFSNGSAFASDAANLFWDDTNKRLGVGTNAPSATAHFKGSGSTAATTSLLVQNSAGLSSLRVNDAGSVFNLGGGSVAGNTAFGNSALIANTTGANNTAYGNSALTANTTGNNNTAVGFQSLLANTTGGNNMALGSFALNTNTTGNNNAAIGLQALQNNISGSNNTAIGRSALGFNTASNNTAVGFEAAYVNGSGTGITAIGYQALRLSTGNNNTAVGDSSLISNTTGQVNTAIGVSCLGGNTTGGNNSALGYGCSSGNFSGSVILGRDATATANNQFVVGSASYNAGAVTTATALQTKTWDVIINGVAQKILLA